MATVRISRFNVDASDADTMVARRNALVDAVRAVYSVLEKTTLARLDDRTWIDVWTWSTRAEMEAALAGAPNITEARPAFALTTNFTAEDAELVNEH